MSTSRNHRLGISNTYNQRIVVPQLFEDPFMTMRTERGSKCTSLFLKRANTLDPDFKIKNLKQTHEYPIEGQLG